MFHFKKYLSLVKFSHTIFAMPFALIGFFLALKITDFSFNWLLLVAVILCMVFARNAAMAFNRYLDRKIDSKNPRTAELREIPKGTISPLNALLFVVVNCLLFIATTYFINPLCMYLSPIALLVILGYSYTKRFTALCHLILGLGLALAPLGAFLAVTGEFYMAPILFSLTVLFWVSGFDIIYSLQDEEFDKTLKLHSIPVLLGKNKALQFARGLHIATAVFVVLAGFYIPNVHWLYLIACLVFCCLLIYQHILVKPNDLSKVNLAFFTTNGIASVAFGILVLISFLL